jgi:hypothetical protein
MSSVIFAVKKMYTSVCFNLCIKTVKNVFIGMHLSSEDHKMVVKV